MNWRNPVYFSYASLRGYRFPALLAQFRDESERDAHGEIATSGLRRLLRHSRENVPYYSRLLKGTSVNQSENEDPRDSLLRLPILTKTMIRENFADLQSADCSRRKCFANTSGGSTGEPVRLIQDADYRDHSSALSYLCTYMLGCDAGQPVVRLWGNERELEGTKSRKARFFNWLTNTVWLNAFRMSPDRMRNFIQTLNQQRPRLVVAYAQAIYELARFAEQEGLVVERQRAVLTSAGTLYPFMREKISRVFGCEVYNLYGSREVSDIAWELPGMSGLWVAPWGNFVEILDDHAQPVEPGAEGNIVVTCLMNHAMPLIRYWIGDRGALLSDPRGEKAGAQVLKHVSGRNVDVFRTRDHTLIDGEYFTHLLYFRPWVWKFQVVQKSPEDVLFKIVSTNGQPERSELDEIAASSRRVMGADCRINFEFLKELPPHPSGKFRYTISEVPA